MRGHRHNLLATRCSLPCTLLKTATDTETLVVWPYLRSYEPRWDVLLSFVTTLVPDGTNLIQACMSMGGQRELDDGVYEQDKLIDILW